jgi:hypothetical protein
MLSSSGIPTEILYYAFFIYNMQVAYPPAPPILLDLSTLMSCSEK